MCIYYICIYINIYIYRRANGIYIQKSCSIWTVCPCLGSELKNINSYEKNAKNLLVKLCFSLNFIPLRLYIDILLVRSRNYLFFNIKDILDSSVTNVN